MDFLVYIIQRRAFTHRTPLQINSDMQSPKNMAKSLWIHTTLNMSPSTPRHQSNLNSCFKCRCCCWNHSSIKLLLQAPNILTEINDVYSVYIKPDDSEVLTLMAAQHVATQTVIFVTITGLACGQRGFVWILSPAGKILVGKLALCIGHMIRIMIQGLALECLDIVSKAIYLDFLHLILGRLK